MKNQTSPFRRVVLTLLASCALQLTAPIQVCGADLYASGTETGSIFQITPAGAQTIFSTVSTPRGLAFDASGNLYVSDGTAQAVIKISPGGGQTNFASGLNDPRGIVFDAAGNLLVCNAGNNEILKFTPAGAQSTFASGLSRPADIAFDAMGDLFESDRLSGSLIKFTPAGVQSTFATGLNLPAGLAFDSAGNLFVVDQGSATILKFAADGSSQSFAVLESGDFPIRLAIDVDDNLYLSDLTGASGPLIYKFTPAGGRTIFVTESETVGFLTFGGSAVAEVPSQLLNISTRLAVGTGDNALIGGFIIDGSAPKQVVLRAIGPSLGAFGIPNPLANPTLELHASDGSVMSNNNWKDTQQSQIEATGFAPTNDLESVILATLAPGAYTAIVRGVNDGVGVGLVEAYDLDPNSGSLANISTRGSVDTGDNVMIGGFILGPDGAGDTTVLVRALGPSLGNFGVANALPDPVPGTPQRKRGHRRGKR